MLSTRAIPGDKRNNECNDLLHLSVLMWRWTLFVALYLGNVIVLISSLKKKEEKNNIVARKNSKPVVCLLHL